MGNTAIEFQHREFFMSEGDLGLIMHIFGIQGNSQDPTWLQAMRRAYAEEATSDHGYGLLPMLDHWLENDRAKVHLFQKALIAVAAVLEDMPEVLPAAERSRMGLHGGGPPEHYGDWSVAQTRIACRALRLFLEHSGTS
jgi:hypothetical protein